MVDSISQHTHCQICRKAIPINESLCSEDCKQKYQAIVKRRKLLVYIMYLLIAFILVLLLFNNI